MAKTVAVIQEPEFERIQTTDPRESKLKDTIEKGKANLHKALEEIQHEFSIREDMAVRPTAIDFLVQDHKLQPVIRDEAYDLTDHSHGQMLTRAGIPAQFAQKLMDLEEREILSKTLKRLTDRIAEIPATRQQKVQRGSFRGRRNYPLYSYKDGIIFLEAKYLAPVSS